ncbi:MAG: PsiF family protein [Casimicrobiaceae bacterium]
MFACGIAYAQDKKSANSQQSKMGECNKEAGDKKGGDRKKFMSSCLKKDKPVTQREKMKTCNKDATGKKGDDRKKFMSECLKADKK